MPARFSHSRTAEKADAKAEEDKVNELKRTLVVLPCVGKCTCGMMLTERDRNQGNHGQQAYTCPHCGRSGAAVAVKKVEAGKKAP